MTIRACAACGEASSHVFRFNVSGCVIWQCERCGLGHAETSGFDPTAYYTANYFSGQCSDGYLDYQGSEPVLRREFARSVDFVRRFRPSGRLLDLGCAYGFFLKEARRHFDVTGIELADDAAQACRQAGLQVCSGVADEATMARIGAVDVITMFDVIEHLPQPRDTLALCCRYLKPGGVIVLTTGDFAALTARLLGARWRLMTPPQHLWFFTPASVQRLASRLEMHVEALDRPWKLVPLSLILFQLGRMFGASVGAMPRASRFGIPVNLFDAMRIVLRRVERA
jgi:SAM-dependent methyltransferase